jgi:hypothetical protein
MQRRTQKTLKKVLDRFAKQFLPTIELVDHLIRSRTHAQEILLLLCSRLDALASSSVREDESGAKAFAHFITAYGRRRQLFDSVSVGDLYYEVAFHRWLLPGTLVKAGRLHRFSQVDDGILFLLTESDLPLTQVAAKHLLTRILAALRKNFRTTPTQSKRTSTVATEAEVTEVIIRGLKGELGKDSLTLLRKALKPLLNSKTISRILYEKFRCGVIHGGHVLIDQGKFFSEAEPYWAPLFSEYYGDFLHVEFPAKFLASLLQNCIDGYRHHLIARGKLPPDILFQVFEADAVTCARLVDSDLLPGGGPVRFAVPRR